MNVGVVGAAGPDLVMEPYYVSAGEIYTGKSIMKKILIGREN